MEINGLPLHPLVVHSAVVFTPLAALTALAYLAPRFSDRLRWPMAVITAVAVLSVIGAVLTGNSFRDANDFFNDPASPVNDKIDTHQQRGYVLMWVSFGFALMVGLNAWLHERDGAVRWILRGLLAVDALAILVLAILAGDSGASAVWDGFNG